MSRMPPNGAMLHWKKGLFIFRNLPRLQYIWINNWIQFKTTHKKCPIIFNFICKIEFYINSCTSFFSLKGLSVAMARQKIVWRRSFFWRAFFGSFFWRLQKMNKKPSQKYNSLESVIYLKKQRTKSVWF